VPALGMILKGYSQRGRDQIVTSRRGGAEAYVLKGVWISDDGVHRCSSHVMGSDPLVKSFI
jgi:hypothetical protein